MLIDSNLSDENKKHLRDIAVPVLVAGLSTLFQELAKVAVSELKNRLKKNKEEKTEEKKL